MIVAAHKCNATVFSPPANTALDLTCSLSKRVKKVNTGMTGFCLPQQFQKDRNKVSCLLLQCKEEENDTHINAFIAHNFNK